MRKLLLMLLTLCLIILPAAAPAAPASPYDPGLMLRYQALTAPQQAIFDLAYAAALQGQEEIPLPEGTRYDDVKAAVYTLLVDCPELCALGNRYEITYLDTSPQTATMLKLHYVLTPDQQRQTLDFARAVAAQVTGDAWERERVLHDLICKNVTYLKTGTHVGSVYGALTEGQASCEGYASTLVLLCRLAGIPSMMVTGDAAADDGWGLHAWCMLILGGTPVLTDPTWNDQEKLPENVYWYFNLTSEQMHRDHRPDDTFTLPLCTDESLSWYARTGRLVSGANGEAVMDGAVMDMVTQGEAIHLRFASASRMNAFLDHLDARLLDCMERSGVAREGSYSIMTKPEQDCVVIVPSW